MSTFLDKNKKKSALAALLLFLRTRKTITALLVMVALASFLFVSPSNILLNLPGGARVAAGVAWIAGKAGVDTSKWGLAGGKRDYDDLVAAFRAAKDGGGKAGWAAFMRGGGDAADAARSGGASGSLNFVKGNAKDLESTVGSGAKLPKPGSVAGVLNPDDARNRGEGEGVALLEGEMSGERAGRVKSAFASGFGSGAGGDGNLSGGAFAAAGFFKSGKGATSGKLSDLVKGGVDGIKADAGKGMQIKGAAKGQMSASKATTINSRTSRGLVGTHTISGQRAFVQLAAGRGRAAISVAPHCTAGSGCPGEFAATNTGAVYDGNNPFGERTDILTVPEIDGTATTPNLPDSGMADDYIEEAEKMVADAEKCRELDEEYADDYLAFDQQQEALSNQFDSMGCGQGGCSKSKAKACQSIGDAMKDTCKQSMTVRCAHIKACPLTANNYCSPSECDGVARKKSKVVLINDGVRTRTMDDEETQECISAKSNVVAARTATQNAVDAYRGNGCEPLYSDTTFFGKLQYLNNCKGRENQVVNNCKNYTNALCQMSQACLGGECAANTDQCVITDLTGIEAFINTPTGE